MGLDFPNLPYFIDNDLRITEHLAIHQYVADKWMPSLLGTTVEEKAQIDMLAGEFSEMMKSVTASCYTNQSKDSIANHVLVKMEKTADYIKKCGQYLIGSTLCYLDFYLYELLQLADFLTEGHLYKEYPQLDDY